MVQLSSGTGQGTKTLGDPFGAAAVDQPRGDP
jgi:hypothetical protein